MSKAQIKFYAQYVRYACRPSPPSSLGYRRTSGARAKPLAASQVCTVVLQPTGDGSPPRSIPVWPQHAYTHAIGLLDA